MKALEDEDLEYVAGGDDDDCPMDALHPCHQTYPGTPGFICDNLII